jgi:CRISPR-associated protein Csx14
MVGFPIVELLAVIGLSHARPMRFDKLRYGYAVLGQAEPTTLFAPPFHRAALGRSEMPLPTRTFALQLGWPGQENQARCILDVFEEIAP